MAGSVVTAVWDETTTYYQSFLVLHLGTTKVETASPAPDMETPLPIQAEGTYHAITPSRPGAPRRHASRPPIPVDYA